MSFFNKKNERLDYTGDFNYIGYSPNAIRITKASLTREEYNMLKGLLRRDALQFVAVRPLDVETLNKKIEEYKLLIQSKDGKINILNEDLKIANQYIQYYKNKLEDSILLWKQRFSDLATSLGLNEYDSWLEVFEEVKRVKHSANKWEKKQ